MDYKFKVFDGMTYKVIVRTLNNALLVYNNVEYYEVVDGYLTFTDSKTGIVKRFPVPSTEIEEER